MCALGPPSICSHDNNNAVMFLWQYKKQFMVLNGNCYTPVRECLSALSSAGINITQG